MFHIVQFHLTMCLCGEKWSKREEYVSITLSALPQGYFGRILENQFFFKFNFLMKKIFSKNSVIFTDFFKKLTFVFAFEGFQKDSTPSSCGPLCHLHSARYDLQTATGYFEK